MRHAACRPSLREHANKTFAARKSNPATKVPPCTHTSSIAQLTIAVLHAVRLLYVVNLDVGTCTNAELLFMIDKHCYCFRRPSEDEV